MGGNVTLGWAEGTPIEPAPHEVTAPHRYGIDEREAEKPDECAGAAAAEVHLGEAVDDDPEDCRDDRDLRAGMQRQPDEQRDGDSHQLRESGERIVVKSEEAAARVISPRAQHRV